MAPTSAGTGRITENEKHTMDSKNLKKWAPLGAAGVLGVGAAGLGYVIVSQQPRIPQAVHAGAEDAVTFDEIVVAKRAISAGETLSADLLTVARVERSSRPTTAFGRVKELTTGKTPRIAGQLIAKGQPIMAEHLAEEGAAAGLAAMLEPGFRAMSIRVEPDAALRGFLKPDARVDIVATIRGEGAPVVRTIVQNIRVLAVDTDLAGQVAAKAEEGEDEPRRKSEPEGRGGVVTLMVTPEQAGRVDLAMSSGTPRLVLRGGTDAMLSRFEGLTLAELRGTKKDDPVDHDYVDPWATVGGSEQENDGSLPAVVGIDTRPVETPSFEAAELPTAEPAPTTRPRVTRPVDVVIEVIRGATATAEKVRPSSADANSPAE